MSQTVPRLSGVLETSLYVADLDRAAAFYRGLFGLEMFVADQRMIALGLPGSAVLLLFAHAATDVPAPGPGGTEIPSHGGNGVLHLCFAIPFGELAAWERHLAEHEVAVESRIRWPRGGTSLYFRDPDGHSIELATPGLWPNA
jgi:catechol 2,3-dioxygenase-like lactoylglutathione lyase family enzyme